MMATEQLLAQWTTPRELKDRGTRNAPALTTNGNVVCMAWRDIEQDCICVSISRDYGLTWSYVQELADRNTRNAPSLCTVNGKFIMAWREMPGDSIWTSYSIDGLNWSPKVEHENRKTFQSPSLAGVDGLGAVMAWRGTGQANINVSYSQDGIIWGNHTELSGCPALNSPAISGTNTRGGMFGMLWVGLNQESVWTASSENGRMWGPKNEVNIGDTDETPTLLYADQLEMFYSAWQGPNEQGSGNIYVSWSRDGVHYVPKENTGFLSQNTPALTTAGNTILMAYRGYNNNSIFVSYIHI
jgi:hypothetical protein